jgi:hypothetical protein
MRTLTSIFLFVVLPLLLAEFTELAPWLAKRDLWSMRRRREVTREPAVQRGCRRGGRHHRPTRPHGVIRAAQVNPFPLLLATRR